MSKNDLELELSFIDIYEIYFGEKIVHVGEVLTATRKSTIFNDQNIDNIYELYGILYNNMFLEPCGKDIIGNNIWKAKDLIKTEIIDKKQLKKYIKNTYIKLKY